MRQQFYLQLRRAIKQGTFKPGTRLPTSREQSATRPETSKRDTVLEKC